MTWSNASADATALLMAVDPAPAKVVCVAPPGRSSAALGSSLSASRLGAALSRAQATGLSWLPPREGFLPAGWGKSGTEAAHLFRSALPSPEFIQRASTSSQGLEMVRQLPARKSVRILLLIRSQTLNTFTANATYVT